MILPERRADEIRHALSRLTTVKFLYNEIFHEITFSSGWTNYKAGDSLDELLERADESLYGNKRAKTVTPEAEICSEGDQLLELNPPFNPIQQ